MASVPESVNGYWKRKSFSYCRTAGDDTRRIMENKLDGKKVAILVADGFEESELTSPKEALEDAGAETEIISPAEKNVRAWDETDWGGKYKVDVTLNEANPNDYDALLLPGGL